MTRLGNSLAKISFALWAAAAVFMFIMVDFIAVTNPFKWLLGLMELSEFLRWLTSHDISTFINSPWTSEKIEITSGILALPAWLLGITALIVKKSTNTRNLAFLSLIPNPITGLIGTYYTFKK